MARRLLTSVLVAVLLVTTGAAASAVTHGGPDDGSTPAFPAVGAMLVDLHSIAPGAPEDTWVRSCTVSLISADPVVALTAAHCVSWLLPGDEVAVTFAARLPEPTGPRFDPAQVDTADLTLHRVERWTAADSGPSLRGAHAADVALLWLEPTGDLPAPLRLDDHFFSSASTSALRAATYVNVGYGVGERVMFAPGQVGHRWDRTRGVSESAFSALRPAFVMLSQNAARGHGGTCAGDSGGPVLVGGRIVAVISWGDAACKATNNAFRLDTPAAQDLLASLDD